MKNVMSVRVSSEGRRRLRELARREKKEMSTVARELMDYGWIFPMLRDYRAGRVSLGMFAHTRLSKPKMKRVVNLFDEQRGSRPARGAENHERKKPTKSIW